MMGLSFEGVEEEALVFFAALEKVQYNNMSKNYNSRMEGTRVPRELKNL